MAVLYRRIDSSDDSGTFVPVDIAGFCVAGAIVLGLAVWAFMTLTRRHAKAKTKSMSNDAFLSIQVLGKDGLPSYSEKTLPENVQMQSKEFSRQQIDDFVTLPDKVLQRPLRRYTSNDVIEYHRQSGKFSRPFSFALSPPCRDQARLLTDIHESIFSVSHNKSRFSAFSINSSVDSNFPTTGTAYKVKRVFEPVLPDELLIRVGESLTLVEAFDDGWSLVGRENNSFVATPKCLFRPNTVTGDGIELGVVPAWCFIKPAPGLHAERPIRSTSLGITVQLNTNDVAPRDNIVSWSNL